MTVEEHKKSIEESLESVNRLVYIKEYVNGYVNVVGERTDLKVVRDCLQAMYDYINALEEKRLDDPMCFENFIIENSKDKKNLLSKIETQERDNIVDNHNCYLQ